MNIDNPTNLIEFVKTNFRHEDYIVKEDGKWIVTDEWLVGTFAGRGFVGGTVEESAMQLIDYLNRHVGHDSIVGGIVKASGWPDNLSVETYIKIRDAGKEEK